MRTGMQRFWQIGYKGFTYHLVVYAIEVMEIILNLCIFLRKDFKRRKTLTNKKPTNKTKISEQKTNKDDDFLHAQTSKGIKVACFAFGAFFYAWNLFVKK